jgi:beta-glucanase (GH16 family)
MHLDDEVAEAEGTPGREDELGNFGTVPIEEQRQELERVLQRSAINRSANLVRFLQFICAKYFEGEAHDIRERTVAVEALGRKEANFDSHADPIVRVTARDLRKKLADFYAKEGRDHPVQILLPRGRYVPQFIWKPDPEVLERLSTTPHPADADLPAAAPSVVRPDAIEEARVPREDAPRTIKKSSLRQTTWRLSLGALVVGGAFTAGLWIGIHHAPTRTIAVPVSWGAPAWGDEFDGPAQRPPNPANWMNDNSQPGRPEAPCGAGTTCASASHNAFLDGAGHLVLRASRNVDGSWSTAKLSTRGLHNFKYGRIEARMKLPVGIGLWPAFWMMGSNFPEVGWPNAGSVDVMENVMPQHGGEGLGRSAIRSTLHGPAYFGQAGLWHDYKLPGAERVDNDFHTYGIIWSPQRLQFYVDDPANVFFEKDASNVPQGTQWVFDHPFYIVMDMAVGGDWPGSADNTTPNPADLVVDYVRVYNLPAVLSKSNLQ